MPGLEEDSLLVICFGASYFHAVKSCGPPFSGLCTGNKMDQNVLGILVIANLAKVSAAKLESFVKYKL